MIDQLWFKGTPSELIGYREHMSSFDWLKINIKKQK
jgi:hypothetical protein